MLLMLLLCGYSASCVVEWFRYLQAVKCIGRNYLNFAILLTAVLHQCLPEFMVVITTTVLKPALDFRPACRMI